MTRRISSGSVKKVTGPWRSVAVVFAWLLRDLLSGRRCAIVVGWRIGSMVKMVKNNNEDCLV